jgi:hypothetical protein
MCPVDSAELFEETDPHPMVLCRSRDRSETCPMMQPTPVAVGAIGITTVSIWRPRAPTRSMTEVADAQTSARGRYRTVPLNWSDATQRSARARTRARAIPGGKGYPCFPFPSIGCGHLGQTNRGGRLVGMVAGGGGRTNSGGDNGAPPAATVPSLVVQTGMDPNVVQNAP